jgi:uncharacterized protein involved in type VI secretion and phage assembly
MGPITPERTIRDARLPDGLAGPWYGVYPALVTDSGDPDHLGRVKVTLPWMPDARKERYEAWARVATLTAGDGYGSYFIPDVGTEVLVAFEGGDARSPYVVGALWNGQDRPPTSTSADPQNSQRVLRSRRGVTMTLDDDEGHEQLVLETPGGQRLTLTDGPSSIEIADSHGNRITLQPARVSVQASSQVEVSATQVTITAAVVNVTAGVAKFSAVLQADTLIANNVVASSYTPGAGNVW